MGTFAFGVRRTGKILALLGLFSAVLTMPGCFWLFPLTQPTEVHYAETPDHWELALHRYKPEQIAVEKEPVLLVHGFASNHFVFDLAKDRSLALYLYERGYDVWMLELRGAGDSTSSTVWNPFSEHKPSYNFDTYVEIDAPTAIEYVRFTAQRDQVSWVGHSLGAMLGYAYMGMHPENPAIRAFVAMAGPGNFKQHVAATQFMLKLKPLVGVFAPGGKIYSRLTAQAFANAMGNLENDFGPVKSFMFPWTSIESIMWNNEAMDARTMSMVSYNTVSDLSLPLIEQMIRWFETGEFESADGVVSYEQNLDRVKVPTLLMTGKLDVLCPPYAARTAFDKIGTLDKVLRVIGTANGATRDYGHMDLIMGDNSRVDVFPQVFNWLEQH